MTTQRELLDRMAEALRVVWAVFTDNHGILTLAQQRIPTSVAEVVLAEYDALPAATAVNTAEDWPFDATIVAEKVMSQLGISCEAASREPGLDPRRDKIAYYIGTAMDAYRNGKDVPTMSGTLAKIDAAYASPAESYAESAEPRAWFCENTHDDLDLDLTWDKQCPNCQPLHTHPHPQTQPGAAGGAHRLSLDEMYELPEYQLGMMVIQSNAPEEQRSLAFAIVNRIHRERSAPGLTAAKTMVCYKCGGTGRWAEDVGGEYGPNDKCPVCGVLAASVGAGDAKGAG